jgi:hypothetical protein
MLRVGLAACLAAWWLVAPAVRAQPSVIDKDTARTLVQQGDERAKRGDVKGALEAYKHADEIMGVPTTGIEVGRSYVKLGRLVEAKAAFQRVTRHPPRRGEPAPFTGARKAALRLIRQLRPRIPRLTLTIEGEGLELEEKRAEVAVLIGGALVAEWQSAIEVNPGRHEVVVAIPGYETVTKSIELAERASESLYFFLAREVVGKSAPPPESSSASAPWVASYIGLAGTVLFGAAGTVTGVLSLSDASAVSEQCVGNACPPRVDEQLKRSRTLAHVSTTMFVLTGLAAASGMVGLALALGDDEKVGSDSEDVDEKQVRGSAHRRSGLSSTLFVAPTGVMLKLRF